MTAIMPREQLACWCDTLRKISAYSHMRCLGLTCGDCSGCWAASLLQLTGWPRGVAATTCGHKWPRTLCRIRDFTGVPCLAFCGECSACWAGDMLADIGKGGEDESD